MERIGEYWVKHLIGEGGMGKVYEAEERLSKRRVALKVLRPELGRSAKGRELFLNEMTILAHFDHPNIVRCLSCSETDGELVMALELLEGQTLRERLGAQGRFSWTEAVDIVAQMAAALEVTHGQSPPIIHRDLKPENVMLVGNNDVKVMDFGIATAMHAMRQSTTHSVGTLQYMSPEQIDAGTIDARSDLYSLGLVFYELLAGHPPFASESPRELLNLQCTTSPPPLPDDVQGQIPKGVLRLLFALLEKAPDERPESACDVAMALEPFAVVKSSSVTALKRPSQVDLPQTGSGATLDAPIPEVEAATTAPAVAAPRSDTIALLERASAPRELSNRLAIGLILIVCIASGIGTYVLRSGSEPALASETSEARATPEASAKVEAPK